VGVRCPAVEPRADGVVPVLPGAAVLRCCGDEELRCTGRGGARAVMRQSAWRDVPDRAAPGSEVGTV
jgi:hypothetical protein